MINRNIATVLKLDEHDMVDRQCPKPECNRLFKAHFTFLEEWQSTEGFCPYCRHSAEVSNFRTAEQTAFLATETIHVAEDELEELLRQAFQGSKSVEVSTTGDKSSPPIPPQASLTAELEFVCVNCGGTTGVNGVGMFCHFCGESQAAHTALQQLSILTRKLEEAASLGSGSDQVRSDSIESTFKSTVEILEQVGKGLYARLPRAKTPIKRGAFQRFADADQLWIGAGGSDLTALFSRIDQENFDIAVATRHVYVHNKGVVDQGYIDKSGDARYEIGDRVVPTTADALDFVRLAKVRTLQMISDGIATPPASVPPSHGPSGIPKLGNLSESQWRVFEAACAAAKEADHSNLHRDQVVAELPGEDLENIGEALDLLENVGLVSLLGTLGSNPVPLHIEVTMRGLNHYLSHTVPNYSIVKRQIGSAALDGMSSAQQIADETGFSRLVADHVLGEFEASGWIAKIWWSGGDGIIHVPKKAFLRQFVAD